MAKSRKVDEKKIKTYSWFIYQGTATYQMDKAFLSVFNVVSKSSFFGVSFADEVSTKEKSL